MRTCCLLLSVLIITACYRGSGSGIDAFTEGKGIIADNGLIVSAHPESSRIGAEILSLGGNAIDAAAATEFALAVCYPEAGNIGGGGFMVIRTSDGSFAALDYREKAPMNAFRDMYLDSSDNVIEGLSTDTHLASGVPGSVDGIMTAHEKYGRLPFVRVIQPAIDLAEKGFPLSENQAASLNGNRNIFIERNPGGTAFVKDSLWKEGDILRQPDLAATLRLIRDKGREGFYRGKVADLIVSEMKRGNGIISGEDLSLYSSQWRKPLTGSYRGYDIVTISPPSGGGLTMLQILGMCEKYPLKDYGFHTAESIHLIVEAERRAFADRAEFMGDPDFVSIPIDGLTSAVYLSERMGSFDKDKASLSLSVGHGNPPGQGSEETTHYSVVDRDGNAVAATTTLNGTFGSAIVVKGAGFLLNNQMDDFSSKPGFPNMYGLSGGEANSIQPSKRMLSSMTPTIIEKDGKLFMVLGSPGGSTIPTSVIQVLINVIDYEMNVQEAVDTGRFHHQWLPDYIAVERNSVDSVVLAKLSDMSHQIRYRSAIGRVNAICILPDGSMQAGADPRGYNTATGF